LVIKTLAKKEKIVGGKVSWVFHGGMGRKCFEGISEGEMGRRWGGGEGVMTEGGNL